MVNKDLIIDVGDSEVSLALLEDKQLIELNKEKRNVRFSVGDIYLGKVKKIMPGLNAAFINVGYERDAFLHYLDLGAQFRTQHKYYTTAIQKQGKVPPVHKFKPEPDIDKDGKITDVLDCRPDCYCSDNQGTNFNKRTKAGFRNISCRKKPCTDALFR